VLSHLIDMGCFNDKPRNPPGFLPAHFASSRSAFRYRF
jgi:hypothetical protein